jgi:hypothetical protein
METIAFNFHDEKRVLKDKYLKAGDDAANVKWLEIDSSLNLFASHKEFLHKVVDMHGAHWGPDEDQAPLERKHSAATNTSTTTNLNASRTSIFGSARNRSSESIIHSGKGSMSANSNKSKSSVFVHT